MRAGPPSFSWDNINRGQLARDRVCPEEAEQAVLDPHAVLVEIQAMGGVAWTTAVGKTSAGRILVVVSAYRAAVFRPIMAYAAGPHLEAAYFKHQTIPCKKPIIPSFSTPAEEFEWWHRHREEAAQMVEDALAAGETTTLTNLLNRFR